MQAINQVSPTVRLPQLVVAVTLSSGASKTHLSKVN